MRFWRFVVSSIMSLKGNKWGLCTKTTTDYQEEANSFTFHKEWKRRILYIYLHRSVWIFQQISNRFTARICSLRKGIVFTRVCQSLFSRGTPHHVTYHLRVSHCDPSATWVPLLQPYLPQAFSNSFTWDHLPCSKQAISLWLRGLLVLLAGVQKIANCHRKLPMLRYFLRDYIWSFFHCNSTIISQQFYWAARRAHITLETIRRTSTNLLRFFIF